MKKYMEEALKLAENAAKQGEVPVGAVVVSADGKIIGRGKNSCESEQNPVCHAEIAAITEATKTLRSQRLSECTLYVTLEPCPMCMGAIINARIKKLVFGAFDLKAGACGSIVNLNSLPFNHHPEMLGGFMEDECAKLLTDFFKSLRKNC